MSGLGVGVSDTMDIVRDFKVIAHRQRVAERSAVELAIAEELA
jgi:hypothetical protein